MLAASPIKISYINAPVETSCHAISHMSPSNSPSTSSFSSLSLPSSFPYLPSLFLLQHPINPFVYLFSFFLPVILSGISLTCVYCSLDLITPSLFFFLIQNSSFLANRSFFHYLSSCPLKLIADALFADSILNGLHIDKGGYSQGSTGN